MSKAPTESIQSQPHNLSRSIYRRLVDLYTESIIKLELHPGDRVDSINDIIKKHSVSRETAKLVLKILAKDGLIVQKLGKGSFVADLRPRQKIWGVVLPYFSVQYEALVSELMVYARTAGRELRYFINQNSWQEEIRLVGTLINECYEAVIVVPTLDESSTAAFYARLSPRGTVVTLIDHTMTGSFFSYAVQSYDLGVQRGMEYLLKKQPATVAFVRNEMWGGRNLVQELMEETYNEIMQSKKVNKKPVVIERAIAVTAQLVREKNIGAFFCCDDTDAIRIIGRLRQENISIPGDCHLVSYGNTDLARYFSPAITSIDPRNAEMAGTMAGILNCRLEGINTELCQYVVQPELIERQT